MGNSARFTYFTFRRPQLNLCTNALKCVTGFDTIKGALPDDYEIPSGFAPRFFVPVVALDVLRPLLHPEGDVRLRHCRVLAPMPVPEASAHVNDCFCLGDYNVGFAFKPFVAHSEPPAASKQPFADKDFRQGVLASNLCHQTAALLFAYFVHGSEISSKLCQAGKFGKGKEFIVLIRTNQEMVEKNDSKAPSKII